MDGRVLGTTDYVSPEQALGQPVTGQSDLYSLGVVLYEMLTGEVPFTGETPVAVAMRHVREQLPDVQQLRPGRLRRDRRGGRTRDRQGPRRALPRRREHGRRPRGGARDRGLALRAGDRRGDERAAHAARRARAAPAVADAPPGALARARWRCSRRSSRSCWSLAAGTRTAAPASRRTCRGSAGLQPVASARPPRTTTTRSAPGPKTATRCRTSIDGDPNTTWSTEHYYEGTLQKAGGVGVGPVPRRRPGRAAKRDRDPDAHAGLRRADLRRRHIRPRLPYGDADAADRARGLDRARSARADDVRNRRAHHAAARRRTLRYYLVWLTTCPPASSRPRSPEVTLFR